MHLARTIPLTRTILTLALAALLTACGPPRADTIVIGSKNFTEQLVLGEIMAQQIENKTQLPVERRFYLAGTYICQQAILGGRIDIYPEYTGTALTAILHEPVESDPSAVFGRVRSEYKKRFGMEVMPSLGFNNTFAIVIRGEDARRLNLKTLSDAARYTPQFRAGFGYELIQQIDIMNMARSHINIGWNGAAYIQQRMQFDRALASAKSGPGEQRQT